ncbi:hemerythrin domain-containing protein [Pseudoduganella chitinolytica]|uniref:Hemerythrin domain-containing protein n=1 Tax=Pseudoduganella chitinolytica TaxID=34070 RepID=A0ABY8BD21_9BURK|nr:hemerythrin domain-containing protein [Pseudoduganella chitinolytica]WEF33812.1 hemerythrin domain-containing protein [Pseudoduganella chitinolytica]
MLTATYTLVALSVEQAHIRLSLLSFQKYVQSTLTRQQSITLSQLEYACETLERLYQACHWRKVELYLIPALRQATERADQLLDELSRLNASALAVVRRLKQNLEQGVREDGEVQAVREAIEGFCTALLQRLEKEEKELFAIARSAICGDAWFALANKLLAHDAQVAEARRSGSDGAAGDSEPIALLPRLAPPAGAVTELDILIPEDPLLRRKPMRGTVQRAAAGK